MNRIKLEQLYPEVLEVCDISSIYKRRGSRNDFESYRGMFWVSVFRSILDIDPALADVMRNNKQYTILTFSKSGTRETAG